MAASTFPGVTFACVIALFFAAEHSIISYWDGCMKVTMVMRELILNILAVLIFLLHIFLKASRSCIARVWRRHPVSAVCRDVGNFQTSVAAFELDGAPHKRSDQPAAQHRQNPLPLGDQNHWLFWMLALQKNILTCIDPWTYQSPIIIVLKYVGYDMTQACLDSMNKSWLCVRTSLCKNFCMSTPLWKALLCKNLLCVKTPLCKNCGN